MEQWKKIENKTKADRKEGKRELRLELETVILPCLKEKLFVLFC